MKIETKPLETYSYFDLDEFFIERNLIENEDEPVPVPLYVINNMVKYHFLPLNVVRTEFGHPVLVSSNSGFRSFEYELSQDRNGTSIHTYGTGVANGEPTPYQAKGATDVSTTAMHKFDELAVLLARTGYTRLIIYPEQKFIHCDYNSDNKNFYLGRKGQTIKTLKFEDYLEYAKEIARQ